MIEINFIVPDDAIVEISNVQRTLGSELQMHWPKPGITGDEKIRLFPSPHAGSLVRQMISIDTTSHHVSTKRAVRINGRERRVFT